MMTVLKRKTFWVIWIFVSIAAMCASIFWEHRSTEIWVKLDPSWQTPAGLPLRVSFPSAGQYKAIVLAYPSTGNQTHWYPKFSLQEIDVNSKQAMMLSPHLETEYLISVSSPVGSVLEKALIVTYQNDPNYEKPLGVTEPISAYGVSELRFKKAAIPPYFKGILLTCLGSIAIGFLGLMVTLVIHLTRKPIAD